MPARASKTDLLIALNADPALARATVCRLALEPDAWAAGRKIADPHRLAASLGLPLAQVERALEVPGQAPAAARRERQRAEEIGARILTLLDGDYPPRLRDLTLPPPVLYLWGQLPAGPAVAIVGSRRADAYGIEAAEHFARGLAAAGVTVVSGFARGIDAAAHRAALAAPGGWTVAVLGCGLDVAYPSGQERLAEEIAARGAVVTEFPFGSLPRPWCFPVRNRVIAALAHGTLVVQAARRSGSLITARHALELGRDVYAVPGSIFAPGAVGPHALIRDGALLAQDIDDILESLRMPLFPELRSPRPAAEVEAGPAPPGFAGDLLAALPPGAACAPEELAGLVGAGVDKVLAGLLELEIGGWVRRQPGPVFSRSG